MWQEKEVIISRLTKHYNGNCRNTFDPHREPVAVGADTWRCQYCGHRHDPRVYPKVRNQTTASGGGGEPVTVNINIDEDGLNVE